MEEKHFPQPQKQQGQSSQPPHTYALQRLRAVLQNDTFVPPEQEVSALLRCTREKLEANEPGLALQWFFHAIEAAKKAGNLTCIAAAAPSLVEQCYQRGHDTLAENIFRAILSAYLMHNGKPGQGHIKARVATVMQLDTVSNDEKIHLTNLLTSMASGALKANKYEPATTYLVSAARWQKELQPLEFSTCLTFIKLEECCRIYSEQCAAKGANGKAKEYKEKSDAAHEQLYHLVDDAIRQGQTFHGTTGFLSSNDVTTLCDTTLLKLANTHSTEKGFADAFPYYFLNTERHIILNPYNVSTPLTYSILANKCDAYQERDEDTFPRWSAALRQKLHASMQDIMRSGQPLTGEAEFLIKGNARDACQQLYRTANHCISRGNYAEAISYLFLHAGCQAITAPLAPTTFEAYAEFADRCEAYSAQLIGTEGNVKTVNEVLALAEGIGFRRTSPFILKDFSDALAFLEQKERSGNPQAAAALFIAQHINADAYFYWKQSQAARQKLCGMADKALAEGYNDYGKGDLEPALVHFQNTHAYGHRLTQTIANTFTALIAIRRGDNPGENLNIIMDGLKVLEGYCQQGTIPADFRLNLYHAIDFFCTETKRHIDPKNVPEETVVWIGDLQEQFNSYHDQLVAGQQTPAAPEGEKEKGKEKELPASLPPRDNNERQQERFAAMLTAAKPAPINPQPFVPPLHNISLPSGYEGASVPSKRKPAPKPRHGKQTPSSHTGQSNIAPAPKKRRQEQQPAYQHNPGAYVPPQQPPQVVPYYTGDTPPQTRMAPFASAVTEQQWRERAYPQQIPSTAPSVVVNIGYQPQFYSPQQPASHSFATREQQRRHPVQEPLPTITHMPPDDGQPPIYTYHVPPYNPFAAQQQPARIGRQEEPPHPTMPYPPRGQGGSRGGW